MKISDIKVILVNEGTRSKYGSGWLPNYVFVKVYTDAGIEGVGEAFRTGKARTTEAAVDEYARWLVGRDPTEILRNWYAYVHGSRYPLGTATQAALSAVELAMWDIAGKACGLPVYKMLGGPFRDRVRVYASNTLTQISANTGSGEPILDGVRAALAQGFSAVKFIPQPDDFEGKGPRQILDESIERVQTVREAVGEGVDICLDYHGMDVSPSRAVEFARAVEPHHPLFLEEPVPTANVEGLREVKDKTAVAIAAGERCTSRALLRQLLERQALHVIQPELGCNGGILETLKWAAMAEMHEVQIAPHHVGSPVSLLACCHLAACCPNFLIQECNADPRSPFFHELFGELPQLEDGCMTLSDKPGLGIELNEEAAAEYPYKPFDRRVVTSPDGGIGII